MKDLFKNKKNLTSFITLIILVIAIPVVVILVQQIQVFIPRAASDPIVFTGPNVITRSGTQKLKLDDQGKATVGLQLTSPLGPPVGSQ